VLFAMVRSFVQSSSSLRTRRWTESPMVAACHDGHAEHGAPVQVLQGDLGRAHPGTPVEVRQNRPDQGPFLLERVHLTQQYVDLQRSGEHAVFGHSASGLDPARGMNNQGS